jgi:fibronectin type 3 domain-containing protein
VVLSQVGGYPFLDWPEQPGPDYYLVWRCDTPDGQYGHAGTTFTTSFTDSTGFTNSRRFYYVTSVCPW